MHSPVEKIEDTLYTRRELEIFIKRDDLRHGALHGNKYRKLKYHLVAMQERNCTGLMTCGGPYSNHLFAAAAAGAKLGIPTIGLIRGTYDARNPTVQFLKKWKMQLICLDRSEYRQRYEPSFIDQYQLKFPKFYWIPEGGNHPLALQGVAEILEEVQPDYASINYWMCPVGTGCTASGLYATLSEHQGLIAFPVLRGFRTAETIGKQLGTTNLDRLTSVDASYGGFARRNRAIEDFCGDFYEKHQIILDPIYMGKMMFTLHKMIDSGYFSPGTRLMILHTGGLQGIWGYNRRFGTNLPAPQSGFFDAF